MDSASTKPLSALYRLMASHRTNYLKRAQDCSFYTIPSLVPMDGDQSQAVLAERHTALGADLANGLANKLVLALYPAGRAFFRLSLSAAARKAFNKVDPEEAEEAMSKLDDTLAEAEQEMMKAFDAYVPREELVVLMLHLLVAGNALLWQPTKGQVQVIALPHYVTHRTENDYEWVIVRSFIRKEGPSVSKGQAPAGDAGVIESSDGPKEQSGLPEEDRNEIEVFTGQRRLASGQYEVWQEIADGTPVGMRKVFPDGEQPLQPQTYRLLPREHYGRSMAEDYLPDLIASASLSAGLVAGAAIMARMVYLVNPQGVTDATDLNAAPNGSFVSGREEDVKPLQALKAADLAGVSTVLQGVTARLQAAFLSSFAARRQGERVTAEEIRMLANELEGALGGFYSRAARYQQAPLAKKLLKRLTPDSDLLKAVAKVAEPQVITGMEALGRQSEVTALGQWAGFVAQTMGPQAMQTIVDPLAFSRKAAAAMGVSVLGVLKSQKKIDAERQAAQQAQLQQLGTEAAIKGGAPAAGKALVEQQTQVQEPLEQ